MILADATVEADRDERRTPRISGGVEDEGGGSGIGAGEGEREVRSLRSGWNRLLENCDSSIGADLGARRFARAPEAHKSAREEERGGREEKEERGMMKEERNQEKEGEEKIRIG